MPFLKKEVITRYVPWTRIFHNGSFGIDFWSWASDMILCWELKRRNTSKKNCRFSDIHIEKIWKRGSWKFVDRSYEKIQDHLKKVKNYFFKRITYSNFCHFYFCNVTILPKYFIAWLHMNVDMLIFINTLLSWRFILL